MKVRKILKDIPHSDPQLLMIILETKRLLLRRLVISDLDDLFAFYSEPDVVKYIPDAPRTYEETREELEWFMQGQPNHVRRTTGYQQADRQQNMSRSENIALHLSLPKTGPAWREHNTVKSIDDAFTTLCRAGVCEVHFRAIQMDNEHIIRS